NMVSTQGTGFDTASLLPAQPALCIDVESILKFGCGCVDYTDTSERHREFQARYITVGIKVVMSVKSYGSQRALSLAAQLEHAKPMQRRGDYTNVV
ncbi:MAG: hypothetical protein R2867_26395, partial [Caldilineaceae bacterium]